MNDKSATVKLDKKYVVWIKIEAAKAQMSIKDFIQARFPEVHVSEEGVTR